MGWRRKRIFRNKDEDKEGTQKVTRRAKRAPLGPQKSSAEAGTPGGSPLVDARLAQQSGVGRRAQLVRAGQQALGNQAVQRLLRSEVIQAKLTVNPPDDKYEREADRVADSVTRMPEQGEEEEKLQARPLAGQITPLAQRQVEPEEEEEPIQAKMVDGAQVQLQTPPAEQESAIQMAGSRGPTKVTPELEGRIDSLRGGGRPLSESERGVFEPRFGQDLGHVRVHTGDQAAKTAQSLQAQAFTVGKDIVFGSGQYAAGSTAGKRLLAHELTHVVQQQGAPTRVARRGEPASSTGSSWSDLVRRAKAALDRKDKVTATALYRRAILRAAEKAKLPAGIAKIKPKLADIRVNLRMSADAAVVPGEIPKNKTNYWRWIHFGPGCLMKTQAYTEAVVTHELVHVRQFKKVWEAYEASGKKGTWKAFRRPYSKKGRVLGPVELEAEVTILDFLKRLTPAEQEIGLQGLYVAYVHAVDYTPKKGEPLPPITTAKVLPQILAAYTKAASDVKKRMGKTLWRALIEIDPAEAKWKSAVRDLKAIALAGYREMTVGQRKTLDELLSFKRLSLKKLLKLRK
jgi:hypothetical protein